MTPETKERPKFPPFPIIVVGAVLLAVVSYGIVISGMSRTPHTTRSPKNNTQIKNIIIALITDASTRPNGRFVQPSVIDANNRTIAVPPGREALKDNTGNVLSYLIYINALVPDVCVNPNEQSAVVQVDSQYENSRPKLAAVPGEALWDPGFAGTPFDDVSGTARRQAGSSNQSYATTVFVNDPSNQKLDRDWVENNASDVAIVSSRGPTYAQETTVPGGVFTLNPVGATQPGVDSITLLIGRNPKAWTGAVGYADGSVSTEQTPAPTQIVWPAKMPAGVTPPPDNIFINERDDPTAGTITPTPEGPGAMRGRNTYLRPFMVAPWSAGPADIRVWRD